MKKALALIITILLLQSSFAQVDTIRGEAARQFIIKLRLDTTKFLNNAGASACKCIDSIGLRGKSAKEISANIFTCIDQQVGSYQIAMKMYHSMVDSGSNYVLNLNTDKNSNEYQRYYFEMERWLTDSCASIKNAMVADNKESENSKSQNEVALAYYNKGVKELSKDNFQSALLLFESAVEQDAKFSFAWDNIGICKRKLGDLDGALAAYLKSLELDPTGKVPLQNIPVVYQYKKEYDKALEAYRNFSKIFPDDPESYYGAGKIYESKGDYEKALDYMCKAYNAYVAINSPYRVDAENNVSVYYKKLKDMGKEELFYKILKGNHINAK